MTEDISFNKEQLERNIQNLTFYSNTHVYLTCGYSLIATCCFVEWIKNQFKLSELYIPIILGSICIVKSAFSTTKKTNYKLKKIKTNLALIEYQENIEQRMKQYKYFLKK